MNRTAIYPGTFDPVTNGHIDIITRASKLFDSLIVAVAVSERKNTLFNLEERLAMCREILSTIPGVRVESFDTRVVDFTKQVNANFIVKGLRGMADFDYEFQMANMNHRMSPNIETIFLPARPDHVFVSSTMIREIIALGGDASLFLHPVVMKYIAKKHP